MMDNEKEMESDLKEIDLEDGEIESDGEDSTPVEQQQQQQQQHQQQQQQQQQRDDMTPGEPGAVDEWAVRVEKAIANVLKKDGIEVAEVQPTTRKPPLLPGPSKRSQVIKEEISSGSGHKMGRRRKRKRSEGGGSSKEKRKLPPKMTDGGREEDDFEMLCIRGGSPPRREWDCESEQSYSSYSSQESAGEYRRPRKRQRDRRRGGGSGKHFEKRRHDSDNESRHQHKMELCKFYLMDCCAKREKCLYMHSDFPCKYYYLGLSCINRDTCKFSHGRPLSNQLRGILLKHLETAPKEILGDFPRLGRNHAISMINVTHKKLQAEAEEAANANQDSKITTGKPRKSRWCGDARQSKNQQPNEDVLSLKHLTNVLTQDQIDRMATMGIETLGQVQHLTFMQLTELGLSFQQLSEIQLNTMNFVKLGLVQNQGQASAAGTTDGEKTEGEGGGGEESRKMGDIDMRIGEQEIASPDNNQNAAVEEGIHRQQPPKDIILSDLQCVVRPASPEGEQGQDEPKLLIDESWDSDDEVTPTPKENEKDKSCDSEPYWPPAPPVVVAADVKRVVGGNLAKIDYTSQILPSPEPAPTATIDQGTGDAGTSTDASCRDPRKKGGTPGMNDEGQRERHQRPSIYDQHGSLWDSEEATTEIAADQDLRLAFVEGSIRDVDLRLPFKPLMTNYVPATEIDASLTSHAPLPYKVMECDIPPPDYREIRKRTPAGGGSTQDPRVRRILALKDPETAVGDETVDELKPPISAVRVDPRRQREEVQQKSGSAGGIDIQQVLQKSPWYRELGSKNKIMVNQHLSLLSTELKRFAADSTPGKIFDLTVVTHNPTLQHILQQLGIGLGDSGQFQLIEEQQQQQQQHQPRLMEWIPQGGPPQMRPGFMAPQARPGLLGIAPPPIGPGQNPFDTGASFYPPQMPDYFAQPPPGDVPRPRPPFRPRPDRWTPRGRRHFDSQRSPRRDKPKN